ncbi:hypothetical protein [Frigoriglobus tundricola]|uniref:Uncharacterized protein n=1 Tax=Frigoriglobus tundricola TaxID=2774151 RepID=A0A6M5Z7A9_9BACT|nr:hypothetical protein [Frigoriglobus tundricola]QJX01241.1 hypothetical protein FTUN_8880 [Frigoriglobus tundricola]
MLAQLDGVLAEEELRATGGAGLTTEAYHALVLRATGSPAAAERAARRRVAEQMRRGQTPQ